MNNTLRTILLIGVLTGLMILVGEVVGGRQGMMIAFLLAVVTNVGSYWFSDKIALSMAGAQPVSEEEAPELYDIVASLCEKANLPMPRIYLINDNSPNAFATGRDPDHSAVAVTAGILRIMNKQEMEAVLAHEMSHVRNHDILITSMAAVLASVITMLGHWAMYMGSWGSDRDSRPNPIFAIFLAILAPIAASIVQLAISRAREYQADASGAELCGHPQYLIEALAKLDSATRQVPMQGQNPALSSLYIVKPDQNSWFVNLFSTHPPIADRIARLEKME